MKISLIKHHIAQVWMCVTVVEVSDGVESVVGRAGVLGNGSAEARLEVLLAALEHPLDHDALVAAREQVRALGGEAHAQHRQRMPVEHAHCRRGTTRRRLFSIDLSSGEWRLVVGQYAAQIVVPEYDLAAGRARCHAILARMQRQTRELALGVESLLLAHGAALERLHGQMLACLEERYVGGLGVDGRVLQLAAATATRHVAHDKLVLERHLARLVHRRLVQHQLVQRE